MEIAMYYTIQKLEVYIKNLEAETEDELPQFVFKTDNTQDLIKNKELDLKHKLQIK